MRGASPSDVDAVVDAIMSLQRAVVALGSRMLEIDVNPLVVHRRGAVALDAVVRLS